MKLITQTQLDILVAQAAAAPRGRAHLTVHELASDLVQRFFVAADIRTYIRPHRHHTKSELLVMLRGVFEVILFDDDGQVTGREQLAAGRAAFAAEMPPNTWHTLIACQDGSTFLEIKEGPYDPATAVEFAAWAPAEGAATVPDLQKWLLTAKNGDRFQA
jgi:cupin fold WbuC family metalloprotein